MPIYECEDCGCEIADGQVAWTVTVNKEVFDGEAVEILDSMCVLSYCEDCASRREFDRTSVPLKTP